MKIAAVSGLGSVWGAYPPNVLDTVNNIPIGGGEAAMLQTSFGLAALGHEVALYGPFSEIGTYRGVSFRPLREAHIDVASGMFEAVVSWSDKTVCALAPKETARVYSQQLNDMPGEPAFWDSVDILVSPTHTHARFLSQWAPVDHPVEYGVLGAGVTLDYADAPPVTDRPPVISYWSSPDRGLHLLLQAWPQIRKAEPEAELRVFYHLDRFIKDAADELGLWEISWVAKQLRTLRKLNMPGVKVMGALSRSSLREHQIQTRVLAYPCAPVAFTEGFGVAILEGLACGARVVARPDDALEEVYGGSVRWVRDSLPRQEFLHCFADAVVEELRRTDDPRREAIDAVLNEQTWANAAQNLERAIDRALWADVKVIDKRSTP